MFAVGMRMAAHLCLANYYSRGDRRVEKALEMLLPPVGLKRCTSRTRLTRLLFRGITV